MEQDGSVHQVQAQEHQHGQEKLHVHEDLVSMPGNAGWRRRGGGGGGVGVGEANVPVCANGMDDTDNQLQRDHKNPLGGHGDAPVHLVVVDDEQLRAGE